MSGVMNGEGYPIFAIYNKDFSLKERIELSLCGTNGLTEEYVPDYTEQETVYGRIENPDKDVLWRIKFALDYSEYVKKKLMKDIDRIYYYFENNYNDYMIFLIPRSGLRERFFEVCMDGGFKQRVLTRWQGHKDVVLNFQTKNLVKRNFTDTDLIFAYMNLGFCKML